MKKCIRQLLLFLPQKIIVMYDTFQQTYVVTLSDIQHFDNIKNSTQIISNFHNLYNKIYLIKNAIFITLILN